MTDPEQKYITIKHAATLLGVSPLTLRNWDKKGQLVALRHPMNNYRVYKKEDIQKIIEKMEAGPDRPKKLQVNLVEEDSSQDSDDYKDFI